MSTSDQIKKKIKPHSYQPNTISFHTPDLEKKPAPYQAAIKICTRHMHTCGTDWVQALEKDKDTYLYYSSSYFM